MRAIVAASALILALGEPVAAQDEQALRSYFEGRRVTLKIDMPGTADGVDVRADAARAIDYQRYGDRLKAYGAALRAGDSTLVTLVKVKKDLIEFQLGGGGFGTFGDDTSTSVSMPTVEKSSREKDLEKRIQDETDSRRKREMERELDTLQDRREREKRRLEAERARAEELKKERIAYQRLQAGSRFNLRYAGKVPSGIRPEEVVAALGDYIDFSPAGDGVRLPPDVTDWRGRFDPDVSDLADASPALRKGMLRSDAERAFGTPYEVSERREGTLSVVTLLFASGNQRITAEFVEDVLIRYTITSK